MPSMLALQAPDLRSMSKVSQSTVNVGDDPLSSRCLSYQTSINMHSFQNGRIGSSGTELTYMPGREPPETAMDTYQKSPGVAVSHLTGIGPIVAPGGTPIAEMPTVP